MQEMKHYSLGKVRVKVKLFLYQTVETHRFASRRGFIIDQMFCIRQILGGKGGVENGSTVRQYISYS
jgi:hypothetical protein